MGFPTCCPCSLGSVTKGEKCETHEAVQFPSYHHQGSAGFCKVLVMVKKFLTFTITFLTTSDVCHVSLRFPYGINTYLSYFSPTFMHHLTIFLEYFKGIFSSYFKLMFCNNKNWKKIYSRVLIKTFEIIFKIALST